VRPPGSKAQAYDTSLILIQIMMSIKHERKAALRDPGEASRRHHRGARRDGTENHPPTVSGGGDKGSGRFSG